MKSLEVGIVVEMPFQTSYCDKERAVVNSDPVRHLQIENSELMDSNLHQISYISQEPLHIYILLFLIMCTI